MPGRGIGLSGRNFPGFSYFFQGTRLGYDKIMRHEIGIAQEEFDGPTRLDHQDFFVIRHPFGKGSQPNHSNGNFSHFRPKPNRVNRSKRPNEVVGQLHGFEGLRACSILCGECL